MAFNESDIRMEKHEPVANQANAHFSEPTGDDPLVLLAEDNEANIEAMADYLECMGFRVVTARDGLEAVEQAKTIDPELMLIDVQMPRLDGLSAIAEIRTVDGLERVPIIALTAHVMPGDRERCLEAGANSYLSKPIVLKQLVAEMRALLTEKKAA